MNAADREAYLDALGAPAPVPVQAPAAKPKRQRRIVTLLESDHAPDLDFVLPGLLAGSVGMIVGQGAIGKSMLALQIGLGVAAGGDYGLIAGGLWRPEKSGPVTIIAGEDPPEILQKRLFDLRQAAGIDDADAEVIDRLLTVESADGDDIRIISKVRDGFIDGPFLNDLREICIGQRLVIIDPLVLMHDSDENDNAGATHLMRTLRGVAKEAGTTIVVLHHVGKSGAGDREAWTAARGASALTTAVRWQVNLSPPTAGDGISDDEERWKWVKVLVAKANYAPQQDPALLRRGQGGIMSLCEPPSAAPVKAADDGPGFRKDDPKPAVKREWVKGSVT